MSLSEDIWRKHKYLAPLREEQYYLESGVSVWITPEEIIQAIQNKSLLPTIITEQVRRNYA